MMPCWRLHGVLWKPGEVSHSFYSGKTRDTVFWLKKEGEFLKQRRAEQKRLTHRTEARAPGCLEQLPALFLLRRYYCFRGHRHRGLLSLNVSRG